MSPKLYVKSQDRYERKYYPCIEGVVFDNIPCDTASEAQKKGMELFKMAVEANTSAYNEGEKECTIAQ